MYYTYVVRCADGSHYTGIAAKLCRRMREHVEKSPAAARYTRSHSVVALEGLWRSADRQTASRLEYGIKHLTREKKLMLLGRPQLLGQLLPKLAQEDYTHVSGVTLEMCLEGTFHED